MPASLAGDDPPPLSDSSAAPNRRLTRHALPADCVTFFESSSEGGSESGTEPSEDERTQRLRWAAERAPPEEDLELPDDAEATASDDAQTGSEPSSDDWSEYYDEDDEIGLYLEMLEEDQQNWRGVLGRPASSAPSTSFSASTKIGNSSSSRDLGDK